ncbi:hypothetical protein SAMN02745163_04347 [Clostridium cavendishii DSM 21758]|uniref:Uncharacterized protein n=1 Tax=Clostridium cavendishii DSM 21758 TaxID=1121302 RepID=A0A1M6US69_9CLOT|nr:Cof-type HAD-IIB family hydrolase [Clostridium cavendishii]SHK72065.1 hypothetical protein SAMN02745163_04347 [Clostridium cavendishii DSM 21758]
MIKLIASDMDGTLLNEKGELSDEIHDVLSKLEKENIQFVVSSGRQYYNLVNFFGEAKDKLYYISENGTLIMDNQGNEIYSDKLDNEIVKEIIEIIRNVPKSAVLLCGKKGCYIESTIGKIVNDVKASFNNFEIVEDLLEVEDDILRIEIYHEENAKENLYKFFEKYTDKLQVIAIYKHWIEISNLGVNKGSAIKKLQEKLGVSPKETMVFGDYYNDIEMLQGSYYSYAMENAKDEIKSYARFVAKRNSENGVIDKIKEIIF